MSEPRLVLELVGEAGPTIELPRSGVLTLGSAVGRADVVLGGQGVADVHCAVGRAKGGGWALKDLGSAYGTLVNGEKVQSVRLAAGDQLVIGSRRLRVVDPAAPAEPPAAAPAPVPAAPASEPSAARPVQGYRIERALGRGGMGQVVLAVQESLQRRVALKVLADRLAADADFVRRFQAEARAAAALNHPNIVTVHDVWEENGRHYLAMEFMQRGNLEARVVAEGRLPWREVLDVLSDAAKGLVYAELRGIVHRDIKPANLMLNEVGTTKIADLGLATHLEAEATEEGDRKIFGTPHFISPEQARGERVDARSDLYSLGATAYRLLTGRTPFEGSSTREILRGHFFDTPRPVRELAPDVPVELAGVVERLLRKRPEDRYASAGALLHELERLRSQLVHGLGPAPAAAAAPGARRVAAGLVVVVLLAAAAFVAWRALAPEQAPAPDASLAGPSAADEPAPAAPGAPGDGADPQQPVDDVQAVAPPPEVRDDDSVLERLDVRAEEAWRALPRDLSDVERRQALQRLAQEYAGSTWVARFESEAQALDQRIREAGQAAQAADAAAEQALTRLAAAAGEGDPERPLAADLAAMAAVELDPALLADDGFLPRWRAAWRTVVQTAVASGRSTLEAADQAAASGAFEGLAARLGAARDALSEEGWPELPAPVVEALAPEMDALRSTRAALAARAAGLDRDRTVYERARALADRDAFAQAAFGPGRLEHELRAFEVDAAESRLAALERELSQEGSRGLVGSLRTDLSQARGAFAALARAWERGNWKRRTINDPRSRGRANREAVGADARGVIVQEDGSTALIPWSAFCGRPVELNQLFLERLSRPYTPEELGGVEALLRISAVLQAIEEADEMLQPAGGDVFTQAEADLLLEGFELARPWAEQAGRSAALAQETGAGHLLAGALRALTDERWGEATVLLERLLAEHRDTLLARLLSDGRELPGLDPPAPAVAPPPGPDAPPTTQEPRDG